MKEAISFALKSHSWTITEVCSLFNVKRNAYYKHQRSEKMRELKVTKLLVYLKERRKIQPREGCKKIHEAMHEDPLAIDLRIGRDKLFEVMRMEKMLVCKKRSYVKTTDSNHRFHKYTNKIKGLEITRSNQVWVSDITYLQTLKGHCYLALITDVFSRKIVGYDVSNSLELTGCLGAFKRAQKAARPESGLIHHSDRGSQYCSKEYVRVLRKHKVIISMTEENHCYENAIAERVNGILKDEFYLDQCFMSLALAKKACESAIKIYNTQRLHLSLGYKTPEQVYKMSA